MKESIGRQFEMDEVPECIWDAEHGLVVLYRRIGRSEGSRGPFPAFQLVIDFTGGTAAYYAGELPADRTIRVVRAPRQGRFRLLFYPRGSPGLLYGEPIAAIPFDDRLQPELNQPVGARHQLAAWLFRSAAGFNGQRRPDPEEVVLEFGETIEEGLERHDWRIGDEDALAVTRIGGATPDAARGPAVHPFRHLEDEIDVTFTVVPDNSEVPEDLVVLEGFDRLDVPAIIVDLTAFGADADRIREDFYFIHRPHGPDGVPEYIPGVDEAVELVDDGGQRYLCWPCDSACHLDLLGVYYTGGKILQPDGDENANIHISGQDRLEPSHALIGMFYGDGYQMRPMHKIDLDAFAAIAGIDGPPMVGLEIERNAAWAAIDERWPEVDMHGSDDAVAFTLTAYAELLEQLLDAAETDAGAGLAGLMDRHNIHYHRFSEFVQRPDLLYALVAEPRLARLLDDGKLRTDALMDAGLWSPSASLAAALEPDDVALPCWVEAESPAVQRALWLFMLAGGEASAWRDLAIPIEEADADLGVLVKRLRWALTEPLREFLAPTAADLGLDVGLLHWPVMSFQDALARADVVSAASQAFVMEIEAVNEALHGDLQGLRLEPEVLAPAFATALDAGRIPTVEDLRRVVTGGCARLGSAATALAPRVFGLKTRVVLWGLAGALAESADPSGSAPTSTPVYQPPSPLDTSSQETADAIPSHARDAREEPPTEPIRVDTASSPQSPIDLGPSNDADSHQPDPSLVLHWLLAVLADWAFDYPPRAVNDGGDGLDALLAEVEDLLDDLYDIWGLFDDSDPLLLPRWTAARAAADTDANAAFSRAWTRVQRDLYALDDAAAGERDAIGALLKRVEQARDYIIADAVWEGAKKRAHASLNGSGTAELTTLCERMSRSNPSQWEGLAAEHDRLAAAP